MINKDNKKLKYNQHFDTFSCARDKSGIWRHEVAYVETHAMRLYNGRRLA